MKIFYMHSPNGDIDYPVYLNVFFLGLADLINNILLLLLLLLMLATTVIKSKHWNGKRSGSLW